MKLNLKEWVYRQLQKNDDLSYMSYHNGYHRQWINIVGDIASGLGLDADEEYCELRHDNDLV